MNSRIGILAIRLAALGSLLALVGCNDDGAAVEEAIAKVTESCTLNSDCADPLICVFQRCHEPCNDDGDCLFPARCVASERTGVFACQFPDEAECEFGSPDDNQCNAPLLCAADDSCRGPCKRNSDCPDKQVCAEDGVCAGEREVDDEGRLSVDDGAPSSADDAGGPNEPSSTDEDSEDSDDDSLPGDVDAGGALQPEPIMSEMDASTAPVSNSEDAGMSVADDTQSDDSQTDDPKTEADSSAPPGIDYYEVEGQPDTMPNDTREEALPLTTASIWLQDNEEDWFYVDVPDDGKAHVIELTQTHSAGLVTTLQAVAGADFSTIGQHNNGLNGAGSTRTVYVTVGPGTRTLFSVHVTNRSLGRSELSYTLRAEEDEFEPNQSVEAAAPIALNTDIDAQMWVPYISANDKVAADFYLLDLVAGEVTFRLLSVPSNQRYGVQLIPLGEGSPKTIANTTVGATGSWTADIPSDGQWVLAISDIARLGAFYPAPEPHLTTGYAFRVEQ